MELSKYLPFWQNISKSEQELLISATRPQKFKKGVVLHRSSGDCLGLVLVEKGRLRAYILSDEGKEITLYRLFKDDICLFAASCLLKNFHYDITIETEDDCELLIIDPHVYNNIMQNNAQAANFTNQIMSERFSDVMWLMENILWRSIDKRIADCLLDEYVLSGNTTLKITHEKIASHIGSAREVVTRMLKYFSSEGILKLSRGTVEITDLDRLRETANS